MLFKRRKVKFFGGVRAKALKTKVVTNLIAVKRVQRVCSPRNLHLKRATKKSDKKRGLSLCGQNASVVCQLRGLKLRPHTGAIWSSGSGYQHLDFTMKKNSKQWYTSQFGRNWTLAENSHFVLLPPYFNRAQVHPVHLVLLDPMSKLILLFWNPQVKGPKM